MPILYYGASLLLFGLPLTGLIHIFLQSRHGFPPKLVSQVHDLMLILMPNVFRRIDFFAYSQHRGYYQAWYPCLSDLDSRKPDCHMSALQHHHEKEDRGVARKNIGVHAYFLRFLEGKSSRIHRNF